VSIRKELAERLEELKAQGKLLEAERLTPHAYDLELLRGGGVLPGIENYSRTSRAGSPGAALQPPRLLPEDFLWSSTSPT